MVASVLTALTASATNAFKSGWDIGWRVMLGSTAPIAFEGRSTKLPKVKEDGGAVFILLKPAGGCSSF